MNELFIYQLFHNIIKQSFVMEGRFFVAEGYGNDLNANSFDNVVKDVLDSIKKLDQKYPVALLFPPLEIIDSYTKGWSTFQFDMYFLTTTYHNGQGSIKDLNIKNNTSDHPIKYDWKDMAECARGFRKTLDAVVCNIVPRTITYGPNEKDIIKRVSKTGNDRLSGVHLRFNYMLNISCEDNDYKDVDISTIEIPPLDIHPAHRHN